METSITISDTLIGSLCREVDSTRHRIQQLIESIDNSRDIILKKRLTKELRTLHDRQLEVKKNAEIWLETDRFEQHSIKFLLELSSRGL